MVPWSTPAHLRILSRLLSLASRDTFTGCLTQKKCWPSHFEFSRIEFLFVSSLFTLSCCLYRCRVRGHHSKCMSSSWLIEHAAKNNGFEGTCCLHYGTKRKKEGQWKQQKKKNSNNHHNSNSNSNSNNNNNNNSNSNSNNNKNLHHNHSSQGRTTMPCDSPYQLSCRISEPINH